MQSSESGRFPASIETHQPALVCGIRTVNNGHAILFHPKPLPFKWSGCYCSTDRACCSAVSLVLNGTTITNSVEKFSRKLATFISRLPLPSVALDDIISLSSVPRTSLFCCSQTSRASISPVRFDCDQDVLNKYVCACTELKVPTSIEEKRRVPTPEEGYSREPWNTYGEVMTMTWLSGC